MPALTWADADELGFLLSELDPKLNPLSVRFTELRQMVLALDGFAGDPAASTEPALEAIQMAWLEYFREGSGQE